MFVHTRMTANPFTVTPDDTVPTADALMKKHGIRHLPVVAGGKVVGVISKGDVAAALPSLATSLSASEITYLVNKLKVDKAMSHHPITIGPDALLEEAAVLMRDNKIEMLPVVDGTELIGVITESAIFDAFVELLGFRERGTRLTLEATDEPGVIAKVGETMAHHRANIGHIAVYRGEPKSTFLIGVNTTNTDDLEAELAAEGITVLGKLVNP